MTKNETPRETEERLEREHGMLDIPILTVDAAILVVADALEIDPVPVIDKIMNNESLDDHEEMIAALIDNALEHGSQFADIRRALEIAKEISDNAERS